ncbi:MAG: G-D-S-L family lipolytic protein [Pseudodesulfovibrio sp.]|nr:G-D-S-L family lipolytic protein [Pseudodesulfovibrio sp.]
MILCFIGDSLTLGLGDTAGLGWTGRIANKLLEKGMGITSYNLGVRKDSSVQMQHRWRNEVMLRKLPDVPFKLVFSFGVADIMNGVGGEESLAAGISMLLQAKSLGDVMMIGPTPVNDATKHEKIATLSRMFASMCKRLQIPFIPTVDDMHKSFVYGQALNDGDGVHPTADGYADLADHILKNAVARNFFGLE